MNAEYLRIIDKIKLSPEILARHLGRCSVPEWEKIIDKDFEQNEMFKGIQMLEVYYDKLSQDLKNKMDSGVNEIMLCSNMEDFSKQTKLPPIMFFLSKIVLQDLASSHPENRILFIDDSINSQSH